MFVRHLRVFSSYICWDLCRTIIGLVETVVVANCTLDGAVALTSFTVRPQGVHLGSWTMALFWFVLWLEA